MCEVLMIGVVALVALAAAVAVRGWEWNRAYAHDRLVRTPRSRQGIAALLIGIAGSLGLGAGWAASQPVVSITGGLVPAIGLYRYFRSRLRTSARSSL